MQSLRQRDRATITALEDELLTMRIGDEDALARVLPRLRDELEVDGLLAYCVAERECGFDLTRFRWSGAADEMPFRSAVRRFFGDAPRRFGFYDALRPEADQQNRVIEPHARVSWDQMDALPLQREIFSPFGLRRHRQLRALVCDQGTLLAWVGAFHPDRFDARQRRMLRALVPSIQNRLATERRIGGAPLRDAALQAALDALASSAFVLTARGDVEQANARGRAMLAADARGVRVALRDAVLRRPSGLACELQPLRSSGTSLGWLAVVKSQAPEEHVADALARARDRFRLTPRQSQVLDLVVRGATTPSISSLLRIAERTVEFHITSLFDRVGVETRAALVAAVLAPR